LKVFRVQFMFGTGSEKNNKSGSGSGVKTFSKPDPKISDPTGCNACPLQIS